MLRRLVWEGRLCSVISIRMVAWDVVVVLVIGRNNSCFHCHACVCATQYACLIFSRVTERCQALEQRWICIGSPCT